MLMKCVLTVALCLKPAAQVSEMYLFKKVVIINVISFAV